MAKKYKSKVNFNIKKAPLIKYKNGGDARAKLELEEIEMKGMPLFGSPITRPEVDMSKVDSIDTSSFGSEDSKDSSGAAAGIMAAGKTLEAASEFIKTPSLEKFNDSDYGNTQGQQYADKANKAIKNSQIAAKVMNTAAGGLAALPIPGARIAAGVLAVGAGLSKLSGKARAKRQGNKAIDFGESYEKREGNSEMRNDYLASIGETTYKNGGDATDLTGASEPSTGNAQAGMAAASMITNGANMGMGNELYKSKGSAGQAVSQGREAAASAIPIAGLFHAGAEMGTKVGIKATSGKENAGQWEAGIQSAFSPSQGMADHFDKGEIGEGLGSIFLGGTPDLIKATMGKESSADIEKKAAEFNAVKEVNTNTANNYLSSKGETTYKNGGEAGNEPSELVKFFGPSHSKGGINIGGGKEVEGGETMKDGFVHSDQIGYDKKGMPTFDPSKTKVTFADRTKKIDKMFSDRNDSISNKTKESLYAKVEADNRKVGPIADALNGSPSAEGKFLFGKELEEPESLFSNNFNYSKNFGVDKTDLFFKKFGPNEFLAKTAGFKTGNGTGFIPKYPIKSTEKVKKTNPTTEEKIKLTPGDYMGMVSNAPSIINNLAQGMKKAEREKLQLNPEADTIKQMMADRKINFQSLSNELTKERTAGAQDIGNNTRSVGSRNANLQALYANSAEKKAGINLQGQSANNAYRGEEAGVLNSIGAQEAAERVRKQTVDSQNKAVKQNFKNEAFSGMSKQLASTSEILNSNSTNNVTAASVNALSLKYQLDKSVINKLIGQSKTLKEAEEMVKWYKDMEK